jgi:flagella basal body P-ring formation protein FlgA
MTTGHRFLLTATLLLASPAGLAAEQSLTADVIAAALPAALELPTGGAGETSVRLDNPYLSLTGPQEGMLGFSNLRLDPATQRFSGIVQLRSGMDVLTQMPVSGRVITHLEVPVLTHAIRRGELITARDIRWQTIELTAANQNVLHDAASVIGMTPRTSLRAGAPLRAADLMQPAAIKRGALVTMIYQSGRLQLTTRGRALSDAAVGEPVRVSNLASSRTIEGIALSDGTVRIGDALTN